jgi:hypothetical protein
MAKKIRIDQDSHLVDQECRSLNYYANGGCVLPALCLSIPSDCLKVDGRNPDMPIMFLRLPKWMFPDTRNYMIAAVMEAWATGIAEMLHVLQTRKLIQQEPIPSSKREALVEQAMAATQLEKLIMGQSSGSFNTSVHSLLQSWFRLN